MNIQIRKADRVMDCRDVIERSPFKTLPGAEQRLDGMILLSHEVYVCEADGVIAAVWGLVPPTLLSESAYFWLLHTKLVTEHKFLFVRHSQRIVAEYLERYTVLTGFMALGDPKVRKWLEWLGAEFGDPYKNSMPFWIRKR